MKTWQLQEAKSHFSEVVKSSISHGPQEITLHGKPTAVVISKCDYEKLKRRKPSFVELMKKSPLVNLELPITRDKSACRKIDL